MNKNRLLCCLFSKCNGTHSWGQAKTNIFFSNKRTILSSLLFLFVFALTIWGQPTLTLTQTGSGLAHKVWVESSGQFRIAFEASYFYGATKWYDLVNDPSATTDILQNPTNYQPPHHEQCALFNQVFYPIDYCGHVIADSMYYSNVPHSINIVDSSSNRVIIENQYSPVLGSSDTNLVCKERYEVYPDGRIFITFILTTPRADSSSRWCNWLAVGDPSYLTTRDSNTTAKCSLLTLTDSTKSWATNCWAGYTLEQPGWKYWNVVSNTSKTLTLSASGSGYPSDTSYMIYSRGDKLGWVRASDTLDPCEYTSNKPKYLYAYWDPQTPQPYTSWTKASILLAPSPSDNRKGLAFLHGWMGTKRCGFDYGNVTFPAGHSDTLKYFLQLGTKNSSILPNINTHAVADSLTRIYLNEPVSISAKPAIHANSSAFYVSAGPFTGRFEFSLPSVGKALLEFYDLRGNKVNALAVDGGEPGRLVSWNGKDNQGRIFANGIYLVKLKTKGQECSKKISLFW